MLFPITQEDMKNGGIKKDIAELVDPREDALIEAKCVSKMTEIRIRRNMTIYKLVVRDETATCTLTWFNVPFLRKRFIVGDTYKFLEKSKEN